MKINTHFALFKRDTRPASLDDFTTNRKEQHFDLSPFDISWGWF